MCSKNFKQKRKSYKKINKQTNKNTKQFKYDMHYALIWWLYCLPTKRRKLICSMCDPLYGKTNKKTKQNSCSLRSASKKCRQVGTAGVCFYPSTDNVSHHPNALECSRKGIISSYHWQRNSLNCLKAKRDDHKPTWVNEGSELLLFNQAFSLMGCNRLSSCLRSCSWKPCQTWIHKYFCQCNKLSPPKWQWSTFGWHCPSDRWQEWIGNSFTHLRTRI